MSQPVEIFTNDTTAEGLTLMRIISGEMRNWGYKATDPVLEYEATWGEGRLKIEVRQEGG